MFRSPAFPPFGVFFFFSPHFALAPCGFTIEYSTTVLLVVPLEHDTPGIELLFDVPSIIYLTCIYTYRVLLPLLPPLTLLCVSLIAVVATAAAGVRHRVPDDQNGCCLIEFEQVAFAP